MILNWKTTKEENDLINKIVKRFSSLHPEYRDWEQGLEMDITATHLNGCPIDLEQLLTAPDFDFNHDVAGIHHHLDRTTGKLTSCFIPRCAKK